MSLNTSKYWMGPRAIATCVGTHVSYSDRAPNSIILVHKLQKCKRKLKTCKLVSIIVKAETISRGQNKFLHQAVNMILEPASFFILQLPRLPYCSHYVLRRHIFIFCKTLIKEDRLPEKRRSPGSILQISLSSFAN